MDSSDAIQLAVLLLLLGLSAFFSSAETALTTVNKIRVRTLIEEGDKRALRLEKVLDQPSKMLSAILIGNNIVNMSLSSLGTVIATKAFGSAGAGLATGVLTFLVLVFGEITPKTCATLSAEKLSLGFAGVIYGWMQIATPLIFVINAFSMGVLKLLRVDPNKRNDTYTENEIRTIVEVSHQDGAIESEERKMINNVFDLDDHLAKDIMVPRVDMTFLNVNASYAETIEVYRQDLFTRLPVYEENRDNILGILNVKDLILYEDKEHFDVRHILREAYFTHEFKKSSELMMEMRENSISLAIVLDEYGATVGLVTLEDLLEEIVGEIRDEYDESEKELIQKISDYEYIVEGSSKLEDLHDQIGLELTSEDYDSIGGIVIELLDRLPQAGESVTTESGIRLVVDEVEKNRIDKVHIYLPQEEDTAEGEDVEESSGV
ncbi:MAG: HlyC/CorC family transporter [Lachnospiraceae bacterium]|nr:HlyC/CorC family transporter [Lachnospiraceae bacterium]